MNNTYAEENESAVNNIELVDIEDIVPSNSGNSLFLCIARALIYSSWKNPSFSNQLSLHGISKLDLKCDINLQIALRKLLCEYWLTNCVVFSRNSNTVILNEEYSKYFNTNVYDFLIQVYQLSINNFSNNNLYKKHALQTFSNLLNLKIYLKKINGIWRLYEPKTISHSQDETTIYLREFRSDSMKNTMSNKYVRFLLDKKLWLSRQKENSNICMQYSQFNDEELAKYEKYYFCIKPSKITEKFNDIVNMSVTKQIFVVFIQTLPVQSLMYIDTNAQKSSLTKVSNNKDNIKDEVLKEMEFTSEFNTIGKQIFRFESQGKKYLIDYINFIWGKKIFNDEFLNRKIRQYNLRKN